MRKLLFILLCAMPFPARAATSTIDTTLPVASSALSSSVMRAQFTAAYNDINLLYSRVRCDIHIPITTPDGDIVAGNFITYYVNRKAAFITAVYAHVSASATGSDVIIDINDNGASLLGTPIHIDASAGDSATSVTPATITSPNVAANDVISIDVDQADSGNTASGGEVDICYYNP